MTINNQGCTHVTFSFNKGHNSLYRKDKQNTPITYVKILVKNNEYTLELFCKCLVAWGNKPTVYWPIDLLDKVISGNIEPGKAK